MRASALVIITLHSNMRMIPIWVSMLTIPPSGTLFIFLLEWFPSVRCYLRRKRFILTIIMT